MHLPRFHEIHLAGNYFVFNKVNLMKALPFCDQHNLKKIMFVREGNGWFYPVFKSFNPDVGK